MFAIRFCLAGFPHNPVNVLRIIRNRIWRSSSWICGNSFRCKFKFHLNEHDFNSFVCSVNPLKTRVNQSGNFSTSCFHIEELYIFTAICICFMSHNKQWLFPQVLLTNPSSLWRRRCVSCEVWTGCIFVRNLDELNSWEGHQQYRGIQACSSVMKLARSAGLVPVLFTEQEIFHTFCRSRLTGECPIGMPIFT
jgi:hypothetical protein